MFNSDKLSRTKESHRKVNIKQKFISALICFLFIFPTSAWADSQLTIDAKVDNPRATTGDIITYTITLRHDMDLKPSMPDFSIIDGFDVLESLVSKPRNIKGQIEQEYSVKLRADQIGLFTIPPIVISFEVLKNITGKSIPGEIRAPEVKIEVVSVLHLQGQPTDIKDIKEIVQVDRNWTTWVFWGLNIILLMIVLYLFWKYRKVKHKPSATKAPAIPTHEIALRELKVLKQKGLLDRGDAREHFFELSEIFRRYLGKRYNFPAPDWTTDEITEYFQKQDKFESVSYVEAIRILNKSDLIKFAKVQASPGTDEIESIREFIKSTREHTELGLYSN